MQLSSGRVSAYTVAALTMHFDIFFPKHVYDVSEREKQVSDDSSDLNFKKREDKKPDLEMSRLAFTHAQFRPTNRVRKNCAFNTYTRFTSKHLTWTKFPYTPS